MPGEREREGIHKMSHNNERNPWGIEIKKESHTGTIVLVMLGLAVVLGIIGVIVIFSSGMLEQSKRQLDNGDSYELWEKGTAVTGPAVKTGDQTSTLDRNMQSMFITLWMAKNIAGQGWFATQMFLTRLTAKIRMEGQSLRCTTIGKTQARQQCMALLP